MCRPAAEIVEAIKHGAVLAHVELHELGRHVLRVVRAHARQEVDVVLAMERGQLHRVRQARPRRAQRAQRGALFGKVS